MKWSLSLFACFFSILVFAQDYYLFVGTYTSGASKGIYVYHFNSKTGKTDWVSNTDSSSNPSFLAISPNGKFVYAVNEVSRKQAGLISAYAFDPKTGKLKYINQTSSGSENPCHISISKNGKWVLTANYSGGSLAALPVNTDGSIAAFTQHIVHQGKGSNPTRQDMPHVHSVFLSPDEKFLLTPDLGTDKVNIYQFNQAAKHPLTAGTQPFIAIEPGSGPRHLDFSPNGKFVYVTEEMSGMVSVHRYQNGTTSFVERVATHPTDYKGQPGNADIHISADGKFLYASNRGKENNIAIFSIEASSGKLTALGYESTRGEGPRNFSIDPSGNFLLVANQLTNNVEIFHRDPTTGLLKHTGSSLQIPNPVCLKVLKK